MIFDAQTILNFGIGTLAVIGAYLFNNQQQIERRVQRLEDVQGGTVESLKADIKEMEVKVDKLTEKINTLAANIHAQKNADNHLNATLNAILKHLNHETQ